MNDLSIMVDEAVKLNVRTTGIFINNGKVLLHKTTGEGHYALPGGRVKAEEDSIEALKRELSEELNKNIDNVHFMGIMENFFEANGCNYHEYMWMIKADFKDKEIYNQEHFYGHEGEKELDFEWIDLNDLDKIDFRPVAAIPYIRKDDGNIHHIINHS